MLSALRLQGYSQAEIARCLGGRHRSTIGREIRRNSSRAHGHYRTSKAIERANGRRSRSRRNEHFTPADWQQVETLLRLQWRPQQVSGVLRRRQDLSVVQAATRCPKRGLSLLSAKGDEGSHWGWTTSTQLFGT